jgi:hypothetical protein
MDFKEVKKERGNQKISTEVLIIKTRKKEKIIEREKMEGNCFRKSLVLATDATLFAIITKRRTEGTLRVANWITEGTFDRVLYRTTGELF